MTKSTCEVVLSLNLNGAVLVPVPDAARFEYADEPCVIVTPGVLVDSVAVMPVASSNPGLFNVTLSDAPSPRSIKPFALQQVSVALADTNSRKALPVIPADCNAG